MSSTRGIRWCHDGDRIGNKSDRRILLETEVIEKLSSRGAGFLEVPRLIKDGMCSILDCSGGDINVSDVTIRRGIADKDASEVMSVKLRPSVSRLLDTDPRAECFKTFEVWTFAIPSLKRCLLRTTVATSVEQECGMHQSRDQ